MITLTVSTNQRVDFVDITSRVREAVASGGVQDGIVTVYVPHTTCGVTINESDDPDVAADISMQLGKLVPHHAGYSHYEDNADSHIKTSLVGSSEQVFIEHGKLVLGGWQGIFLCDFDGPRTRKVYLKILSD